MKSGCSRSQCETRAVGWLADAPGRVSLLLRSGAARPVRLICPGYDPQINRNAFGCLCCFCEKLDGSRVRFGNNFATPLTILIAGALTDVNPSILLTTDGIHEEHQNHSTGRSQPLEDSGKWSEMTDASGSLRQISLPPGIPCSIEISASRANTPCDKPLILLLI